MIAISASQSQGKSSVLNSLAELGYTVSTQKTSREILKDWNYTLEDVNSFPKLNYNFQLEILRRHRANDLKHIKNELIYKEGSVFQERSYADVFAYTMTSMGSYNSYSIFIDEYYENCRKYQQDYQCVIFLSGRKGYEPEHDGVRSTNKHYAKATDILIRNYVEEFDNGNVLYIDEADHTKRLEIIIEHIKRFQ